MSIGEKTHRTIVILAAVTLVFVSVCATVLVESFLKHPTVSLRGKTISIPGNWTVNLDQGREVDLVLGATGGYETLQGSVVIHKQNSEDCTVSNTDKIVQSSWNGHPPDDARPRPLKIGSSFGFKWKQPGEGDDTYWCLTRENNDWSIRLVTDMGDKTAVDFLEKVLLPQFDVQTPPNPWR